MIKFWIEKRNLSWLRLVGILVVTSFLFSSLSAPFVEASFWQERRKAVEDIKNLQATPSSTSEPIQLASAIGLTPFQSNSLFPLSQTQIPANTISQVLEKVKQRSHTNATTHLKHKFQGIPSELVNKVEPYGKIERVYIAKGQELQLKEGKIRVGLAGNTESARANHSNVPSLPLVIHIQDAHDIYSVQKNIALMIQELTGLGADSVGVEGAEGKIEGIERWSRTGTKESAMGIAGYLLKEGLLTGVEVAGLYSRLRERESSLRKRVEFYGIEDQKKYQEQVKAFKETLKNSKEAEFWVKGVGETISNLKRDIYSEELKRLDTKKEEYEKGEIKLGEWVRSLWKTGSQPQNKIASHQINDKLYSYPNFQFLDHSTRYPNLYKYLKAYDIEKRINFKQVEQEQKKLLEGLSNRLNKQELMELLEESLAYRLGAIGYGEFYGYLRKKCEKAGIVLTPEIKTYIEYLLLVEGIVQEKLFKELIGLEYKVFNSQFVAQSSEQKLYEIVKDYRLLVKAVDFKLSPEEWEEYRKREKEVARIEERIKELVSKDTELPKVDSSNSQENRFISEGSSKEFSKNKMQVVQDVLRNVSKFNELSHERNHIFVEKLLSRVASVSQMPLAILVAGGYHSEGIEQELKAKGISYITIRPSMNTEEAKGNYHPLQSFKRDLLPLEKMFLPEKVTLAPELATFNINSIKGQTAQGILKAGPVVLDELEGNGNLKALLRKEKWIKVGKIFTGVVDGLRVVVSKEEKIEDLKQELEKEGFDAEDFEYGTENPVIVNIDSRRKKRAFAVKKEDPSVLERAGLLIQPLKQKSQRARRLIFARVPKVMIRTSYILKRAVNAPITVLASHSENDPTDLGKGQTHDSTDEGSGVERGQGQDSTAKGTGIEGGQAQGQDSTDPGVRIEETQTSGGSGQIGSDPTSSKGEESSKSSYTPLTLASYHAFHKAYRNRLKYKMRKRFGKEKFYSKPLEHDLLHIFDRLITAIGTANRLVESPHPINYLMIDEGNFIICKYIYQELNNIPEDRPQVDFDIKQILNKLRSEERVTVLRSYWEKDITKGKRTPTAEEKAYFAQLEPLLNALSQLYAEHINQGMEEVRSYGKKLHGKLGKTPSEHVRHGVFSVKVEFWFATDFLSKRLELVRHHSSVQPGNTTKVLKSFNALPWNPACCEIDRRNSKGKLTLDSYLKFHDRLEEELSLRLSQEFKSDKKDMEETHLKAMMDSFQRAVNRLRNNHQTTRLEILPQPTTLGRLINSQMDSDQINNLVYSANEAAAISISGYLFDRVADSIYIEGKAVQGAVEDVLLEMRGADFLQKLKQYAKEEVFAGTLAEDPFIDALDDLYNLYIRYFSERAFAQSAMDFTIELWVWHNYIKERGLFLRAHPKTKGDLSSINIIMENFDAKEWQSKKREDNKSFLNSLAVGVVLGLFAMGSAHFGIQQMGNLPEILAFFLVGGFHFTQSLVILIAAIRAGLNKGPTDESKLIPEFRNLPQEQKSLPSLQEFDNLLKSQKNLPITLTQQKNFNYLFKKLHLSLGYIHHLVFAIKKIYRDFFIPCQVRDGKIYVNARLMQFIPKGMQKIFYQHEKNHRVFEMNVPKFSKVPALAEFFISSKDFLSLIVPLRKNKKLSPFTQIAIKAVMILLMFSGMQVLLNIKQVDWHVFVGFLGLALWIDNFIKQRLEFNSGISQVKNLMSQGSFWDALNAAEAIAPKAKLLNDYYTLSKLFSEIGVNLNTELNRDFSLQAFEDALKLAKSYVRIKYPHKSRSFFSDGNFELNRDGHYTVKNNFEFLVRDLAKSNRTDLLFAQANKEDPDYQYEAYILIWKALYRITGQFAVEEMAFRQAIAAAENTEMSNSYLLILELLWKETNGSLNAIFNLVSNSIDPALVSIRFGEAFYRMGEDEKEKDYFKGIAKLSFERAEGFIDGLEDKLAQSRYYDLLAATLVNFYSIEETYRMMTKAGNTKVSIGVFDSSILQQAEQIAKKRSSDYIEKVHKGEIEEDSRVPLYEEASQMVSRKLKSTQKIVSGYRKSFLRMLAQGMMAPLFFMGVVGMGGAAAGGKREGKSQKEFINKINDIFIAIEEYKRLMVNGVEEGFENQQEFISLELPNDHAKQAFFLLARELQLTEQYQIPLIQTLIQFVLDNFDGYSSDSVKLKKFQSELEDKRRLRNKERERIALQSDRVQVRTDLSPKLETLMREGKMDSNTIRLLKTAVPYGLRSLSILLDNYYTVLNVERAIQIFISDDHPYNSGYTKGRSGAELDRMVENYINALKEVIAFAEQADSNPSAYAFRDLLAKILADSHYEQQLAGKLWNQPLPHSSSLKFYLELAPGTKFLAHMKTELKDSMRYHLVDYNFFVVAYLKKLVELFRRKNVEVIRKNVFELEYERGSVGTIHGANLSNFLKYDAEWWKKASGWLDEGGQLILTGDPDDLPREQHALLLSKLYHELVEKDGWSFDYIIGEARGGVGFDKLDQFVFTKPPEGKRLEPKHSLVDYLRDMIPRVSKGSQRFFERESYKSQRTLLPLSSVGKVFWFFEHHSIEADLEFIDTIEGVAPKYFNVITVLEHGPPGLYALRVAFPLLGNRIKDLKDLEDPFLRDQLEQYLQNNWWPSDRGLGNMPLNVVHDKSQHLAEVIEYLYNRPQINALFEQVPLESVISLIRSTLYLEKAHHALYIERNQDKFLENITAHFQEWIRSTELRDQALAKIIKDAMVQNPTSLIVVKRGVGHSPIVDMVGDYGNFEKEIRIPSFEHFPPDTRIEQEYGQMISQGEPFPQSAWKTLLATFPHQAILRLFQYRDFEASQMLDQLFEEIEEDKLKELTREIQENSSVLFRTKRDSSGVVKPDMRDVPVSIFILAWLQEEGLLSQELLKKFPPQFQEGIAIGSDTWIDMLQSSSFVQGAEDMEGHINLFADERGQASYGTAKGLGLLGLSLFLMGAWGDTAFLSSAFEGLRTWLDYIDTNLGIWDEVLSFALIAFGGFHFTQSLVILIAAVRAGLNKGPADESKLILEFRNLPPSQKSLKSFLTPCKFYNDQIHVNPRLMQFIPKGMQKIFYHHEQNHQRHSNLSRVSLIGEAVVSMMDFGYFRFLLKGSFWKQVVRMPIFAALGVSEGGVGGTEDNVEVPLSPLTLQKYIAIHKEFRLKLLEEAGKEFPDIILNTNPFHLELVTHDHFNTIVRSNCAMHSDFKKSPQLIDLATMYVSEYLYNMKVAGPNVWTYGDNVFIEFKIESLNLNMDRQVVLEAIKDYIVSNGELPSRISDDLLLDCFDYITALISNFYERLRSDPELDFVDPEWEARYVMDRAQRELWMLSKMLHMRQEFLQPYLMSQDDFSLHLLDRTLTEFDERFKDGKNWIVGSSIKYDELASDEGNASSFNADSYRQFLTVVLRNALLLRFAYKFPDVPISQLIAVYDSVLVNEIHEHSQIFSQNIQTNAVGSEARDRWIYITLRLRDSALQYVAMYLYNRILHLHHWGVYVDGDMIQLPMADAVRVAVAELRDEETLNKIEWIFRFFLSDVLPIRIDRNNDAAFIHSQLKQSVRNAADKAIALNLLEENDDIKAKEIFLWAWFVFNFYGEKTLFFSHNKRWLGQPRAVNDAVARFEMEYSNPVPTAEIGDASGGISAIIRLAEEYGLFTPNDFVYPFSEGDMEWWREQNYPEETLRNTFHSLKIIREIATKTKYRVVDPTGVMTREVMIWWAAQHMYGIKTKEQIKEEFLRLAKRQKKRDPNEVSSRASLLAGGAAFVVGVLGLVAHTILIQNFGILPSLGAFVLTGFAFYLNGRISTKHYRWLPLSLEAIFKSVFVVPSFAGFILMIVQGIKIHKARVKANQVRDGPEAAKPSKAELNHLKRSLEDLFKEEGFKATLVDEGKGAREIAYVNRDNPEEVKARKIHIDLLAFYYLPAYLRETILKDHEHRHLYDLNSSIKDSKHRHSGLIEFNAYLNQIVRSRQLFKKYSKETRVWRFFAVTGTILVFVATLFAGPIIQRIVNPFSSINNLKSLMEPSKIDMFSTKIDQTKMSIDEWVDQELAKTDKKLLIFGEDHSSLKIKRIFRSKILPKLKAMGVNFIVLELLPIDAQPLFDQFNQTGKLDPAVRDFFKLGAKGQKFPEDEWIDLLYDIHENGIEVIAGGIPLTKVIESMRVWDSDPKYRNSMLQLQREVLIQQINNLRQRYPTETLAVYSGGLHNDRVSEEVPSFVEPAFTVDIMDPYKFNPGGTHFNNRQELEFTGHWRYAYQMGAVLQTYNRQALQEDFAAQIPYPELADWILYLGKDPNTLEPLPSQTPIVIEMHPITPSGQATISPPAEIVAPTSIPIQTVSPQPSTKSSLSTKAHAQRIVWFFERHSQESSRKLAKKMDDDLLSKDREIYLFLEQGTPMLGDITAYFLRRGILLDSEESLKDPRVRDALESYLKERVWTAIPEIIGDFRSGKKRVEEIVSDPRDPRLPLWNYLAEHPEIQIFSEQAPLEAFLAQVRSDFALDRALIALYENGDEKRFFKEMTTYYQQAFLSKNLRDEAMEKILQDNISSHPHAAVFINIGSGHSNLTKMVSVNSSVKTEKFLPTIDNKEPYDIINERYGKAILSGKQVPVKARKLLLASLPLSVLIKYVSSPDLGDLKLATELVLEKMKEKDLSQLAKDIQKNAPLLKKGGGYPFVWNQYTTVFILLWLRDHNFLPVELQNKLLPSYRTVLSDSENLQYFLKVLKTKFQQSSSIFGQASALAEKADLFFTQPASVITQVYMAARDYFFGLPAEAAEKKGKIIWNFEVHHSKSQHQIISDLEQALKNYKEVYLFMENAPPLLSMLPSFAPELAYKIKSPQSLNDPMIRKEMQAFLDQYWSKLFEMSLEATKQGKVLNPNIADLMNYLAKHSQIKIVAEQPTLESMIAGINFQFGYEKALDLLYVRGDEKGFFIEMLNAAKSFLSAMENRDRAYGKKIEDTIQKHPGAGMVVQRGLSHKGILNKIKNIGRMNNMVKIEDKRGESGKYSWQGKITKYENEILKGKSLPPSFRKYMLSIFPYMAVLEILTDPTVETLRNLDKMIMKLSINDLELLTRAIQNESIYYERQVGKSKGRALYVVAWLKNHKFLTPEIESKLHPRVRQILPTLKTSDKGSLEDSAIKAALDSANDAEKHSYQKNSTPLFSGHLGKIVGIVSIGLLSGCQQVAGTLSASLPTTVQGGAPWSALLFFTVVIILGVLSGVVSFLIMAKIRGSDTSSVESLQFKIHGSLRKSFVLLDRIFYFISILSAYSIQALKIFVILTAALFLPGTLIILGLTKSIFPQGENNILANWGLAGAGLVLLILVTTGLISSVLKPLKQHIHFKRTWDKDPKKVYEILKRNYEVFGLLYKLDTIKWLAKDHPEAGREILLDLLTWEKDRAVVKFTVRQLQKTGTEKDAIISSLLKRLADDNPIMRQNTLKELRSLEVTQDQLAQGYLDALEVPGRYSSYDIYHRRYSNRMQDIISSLSKLTALSSEMRNRVLDRLFSLVETDSFNKLAIYPLGKEDSDPIIKDNIISLHNQASKAIIALNGTELEERLIGLAKPMIDAVMAEPPKQPQKDEMIFRSTRTSPKMNSLQHRLPAIAEIFGHIRSSRAVPDLINALSLFINDPDYVYLLLELRTVTARALIKIGDEKAIPVLLDYLDTFEYPDLPHTGIHDFSIPLAIVNFVSKDTSHDVLNRLLERFYKLRPSYMRYKSSENVADIYGGHTEYFGEVKERNLEYFAIQRILYEHGKLNPTFSQTIWRFIKKLLIPAGSLFLFIAIIHSGSGWTYTGASLALKAEGNTMAGVSIVSNIKDTALQMWSLTASLNPWAVGGIVWAVIAVVFLWDTFRTIKKTGSYIGAYGDSHLWGAIFMILFLGGIINGIIWHMVGRPYEWLVFLSLMAGSAVLSIVIMIGIYIRKINGYYNQRWSEIGVVDRNGVRKIIYKNPNPSRIMSRAEKYLKPQSNRNRRNKGFFAAVKRVVPQGIKSILAMVKRFLGLVVLSTTPALLGMGGAPAGAAPPETEKYRRQLGEYGERYGLKGLEDQIEHGLKPSGMLAIAVIQARLKKHIGLLKIKDEDLAAFAKGVEYRSSEQHRARITRAEDPIAQLYLFLMSLSRDREGQSLTADEFIEDVNRIRDTLASISTEQLVQQAKEHALKIKDHIATDRALPSGLVLYLFESHSEEESEKAVENLIKLQQEGYEEIVIILEQPNTTQDTLLAYEDYFGDILSSPDYLSDPSFQEKLESFLKEIAWTRSERGIDELRKGTITEETLRQKFLTQGPLAVYLGKNPNIKVISEKIPFESTLAMLRSLEAIAMSDEALYEQGNEASFFQHINRWAEEHWQSSHGRNLALAQLLREVQAAYPHAAIVVNIGYGHSAVIDLVGSDEKFETEVKSLNPQQYTAYSNLILDTYLENGGFIPPSSRKILLGMLLQNLLLLEFLREGWKMLEIITHLNQMFDAMDEAVLDELTKDIIKHSKVLREDGSWSQYAFYSILHWLHDKGALLPEIFNRLDPDAQNIFKSIKFSEYMARIVRRLPNQSNLSSENIRNVIRDNNGQAMTEYGLIVGVLALLSVIGTKLASGYLMVLVSIVSTIKGIASEMISLAVLLNPWEAGEFLLATLLVVGGLGLILYGTVKLAQRLQMDSSAFFLQPTEIFGLNLRLNSGQNNGKELKEMEKIEERFKRLRGYLNADETAKAEKEIKKIERLKRNYLSQAKAGLVTSQRNKKALNLLAMGLSLALVTNPSEAQSKAVEDQMRSIVRNEVSVNLPVEPILSSSIGEHSQDYWTGDVEVSDKIEMSQEEINEFEETAWKVAVLAKWASSKVEYKDTSSLASIGEDLPGATKTFDGTALFSNGVSKQMVEGSILNELRRGGEEKIALTAAYGISHGKMRRVVERLIEKEIDKALVQSAKERIVYLSSSNGKRVKIGSVISQLKDLGLGELGIQIITDDPLRLEESMQFNIRVKIYKLMSATLVIEFKTLRDIAEEMKEFRLIHINA